MTTIRTALDDYFFAIKRLAPKTQTDYKSKLGVFAEWCEQQNPPVTIETLKQSILRRFMAELTNRVNPQTGHAVTDSTVHAYGRTLKAFLSWLSREEDYEDTVSEKLARKVEMPRIEQKVLETYNDIQIKALLKACETEYSQELQVRDVAIIKVLLSTGIRASELVTLKVENCYLSSEHPYIRVLGKGSKWREVPLEDDAVRALRKYLNRYRRRNHETAFLGRSGEPLTVGGLHGLIDRLCHEAKVTGVARRVHLFRHSYAMRFLEAGGNVYVLSRLMGHTSVTITEGYLRAYQAVQARKQAVTVLDKID